MALTYDSGSTFVADLSATSPSAASTVAGDPVTGLGKFRDMTVYGSIRGATGGTLDIFIQFSPDGGTTWVDYAHFPSLAAGAGVTQRLFATSKSGQQTTIQIVGSGLTPLITAGTVIGGSWGDRIRVVMVADVGTSAGAAQTIKVIFTQ